MNPNDCTDSVYFTSSGGCSSPQLVHEISTLFTEYPSEESKELDLLFAPISKSFSSFEEIHIDGDSKALKALVSCFQPPGFLLAVQKSLFMIAFMNGSVLFLLHRRSKSIKEVLYWLFSSTSISLYTAGNSKYIFLRFLPTVVSFQLAIRIAKKEIIFYLPNPQGLQRSMSTKRSWPLA